MWPEWVKIPNLAGHVHLNISNLFFFGNNAILCWPNRHVPFQTVGDLVEWVPFYCSKNKKYNPHWGQFVTWEQLPKLYHTTNQLPFGQIEIDTFGKQCSFYIR